MAFSKEAIERIEGYDRNHTWHKYTPMNEYYDAGPVTIARGEGCWLYDMQGKRYLDAIASMWSSVHGYNDRELNEAIAEQLPEIAHTSFANLNHPKASELAFELAKIAPGGLTRTFFNNNGSNAIETALKMSVQYWHIMGRPERKKVISMAGGHHGSSFGAMSISDIPAFHKYFDPLCFPCEHFDAPVHREHNGRVFESDDTGSIAALTQLLQKQGGETAAVILEPAIQSAVGMRLQPPGFLKKIRALCDEFDVHLILDEIFVGFSRTGPLLVCKEEDVAPDFLCLGKGLGAGYLPVAATVTTDDIYKPFAEGAYHAGRALLHGHMYSGNPLACAVALKSLEKLQKRIESGDLAAHVNAFGEITQAFFESHENVTNLRGRGFLQAFDIKSDNPSIGKDVCLRAREKGLLIRPLGKSIFIIPPLSINQDEMTFLCETLSASIKEVVPCLTH